MERPRLLAMPAVTLVARFRYRPRPGPKRALAGQWPTFQPRRALDGSAAESDVSAVIATRCPGQCSSRQGGHRMHDLLHLWHSSLSGPRTRPLRNSLISSGIADNKGTVHSYRT